MYSVIIRITILYDKLMHLKADRILSTYGKQNCDMYLVKYHYNQTSVNGTVRVFEVLPGRTFDLAASIGLKLEICL
jgi:hypothetical protein